MKLLRQHRFARALFSFAAIWSLLWLPVVSQANPMGEIVVSGDVAFDRNGSTLDIMQGTDRAIIEWESFNISNGEATVFHQPGASAVALNRVVGASPSFIDGLLQANGNVWVINGNGIVTGRNARIDVGGLMLSTLDVSNEDFLNGNDLLFSGASNASIVNYGQLRAAQGDVYVFAQQVENHGYIGAVDGRVMMLGSNEVLLEQGNGLRGNISVKGTMGYGRVYNGGEVEGREVTMAAVNNNAMAMGVQQRGAVRITGAEKRDGRVLLVAHGGSGVIQTGQVNTGGGSVRMESEGQVEIGGTTDASSNEGAGGEIEVIGREIEIVPDGLLRSNGASDGGSINLDASESLEVDGAIEAVGSEGVGGEANLTGEEVRLQSAARVDVSGSAGGGMANLGGGFQGIDPDLDNSQLTTLAAGSRIRADALESGDGGRVAVWSDGETDFRGSISADGIGNGGLVEVSGRDVLGFSGEVTTVGRDGSSGILLLDPVDVIISNSGTAGSIDSSALQTAWENNNVVVHTTGAGGNGDINIEENVQIVNDGVNDHSLSFFAHRHILVGATGGNPGDIEIRHTGDGIINLFAGWDGTGGTDFLALPDVDASAQAGTDSAAVSPIGRITAADLAGPGARFGTFGNLGGRIELNPVTAQDNAVSAIRIGSANGQTNLYGFGLVATSGDFADEHVQVGWHHDGTDQGTIGGDINVEVTDFLTLNSTGADRRYVQIGHGISADGALTVGDGPLSGDIRIVAPGDMEMLGGEGSGYVIVGHGGQELTTGPVDNSVDLLSGDITLEVGNLTMTSGTTGAENFTLVGHGGDEVNKENVLAQQTSQSNISVTATGGVLLQGGGNDSFAQIGSGGYQVRGAHRGSITVSAVQDVGLTGGSNGAQSHAMIGFGGYDSDGNHGGSIDVSSSLGSVGLSGGGSTDSFSQIGHMGRLSFGVMEESPITVTAEQNVILQGGIDGTRASVRVGHGGNNADGSFAGDITVEATNGFVSVNAGGDADGDGSAGQQSLAQIGSGGYDSDAFGAGHSGTVRVTSFGDVNVTAGFDNGRGSLIGHGGIANEGEYNGDVFVTSQTGDVVLTGGLFDEGGADSADALQRFAAIGHHSAETAGFGPEFNASGNINVTTLDGDISLTGGEQFQTTAQIGHGGDGLGSSGASNTALSLDGDITLNANGDITVQGGTTYTVVDAGNTSGLSIFEYSYGLVGHGGRDLGNQNNRVSLNLTGDINLANTGADQDIFVLGGDGSGNFGAVGHGGYESLGELRIGGAVNVDSSRDIDVFGGDGITNRDTFTAGDDLTDVQNLGNFGQIGHWVISQDSDSVHRTLVESPVTVTALGDIDVEAGLGRGAHAMIGLGGTNFIPGSDSTPQLDFEGDVTVVTGGDLTLTGADNGISTEFILGPPPGPGPPTVRRPGGAGFAQIGNGGHGVNSSPGGVISGDLDVRVAGNLEVTSGVGFDALEPALSYNGYAKIGHGDFLFDNTARANAFFREGDIAVAVGESATITGGQIGHIDPRFVDAVGLGGNTFIGVSRNDPDAATGTGVLEVIDRDRADVGGSGLITSTLNSNFNGASFDDELRVFVPDREPGASFAGGHNLISEGSLLNGVAYDNPAVAPGINQGSFSLLPNEEFDTNFTFATNAAGLPTGSFSTLAPFTNPFTIYYGRLGPVVPPGPGDVIVLPDVDFEENTDRFEVQRDTTEGRTDPTGTDGTQPYPYSWRPSEPFGVGPHYSDRIPGESSTYIPEDLVYRQRGPDGTFLIYYAPRGFQVYDYEELIQWTSGEVIYVPATGLVPAESALSPPDLPPAVPGTAVTPPEEGEPGQPSDDFDFDFGASGAMSAEEGDGEEERRREEGMEGSSEDENGDNGGDNGDEGNGMTEEEDPFSF